MKLTPAHRTRWLVGVACAVLLASLASPARADEKKVCLLCHGNQGSKGTRDGQEIDLYVSPEEFGGSVHADIPCSKCHADVDPLNLPHPDKLKRATCDGCHPDQVRDHKASRHGQVVETDATAPTCASCHTKHGILKHTDVRSPTSILNIPGLCGKCHHEGSDVSVKHDIPQNRILENYSQSIHGAGLFKQGLTVTAVCISCHTSHRILPHTDPESTINPRNVAKTCMKCHGLVAQVHRKVIEGRDWETESHTIPACSDCHSPHKPRPEKTDQPENTNTGSCLSCHAKPALTMMRDGKSVSVYVDPEAYQASTHGQGKVECAACHTEVQPIQPGASFRTRTCDTIRSKVDCSACHEEANEYRESTHGTLRAAGDPDAPGCLDCHSKHATQSRKDPTSPTFARNIPELCARCHRAGEKAAVRIQADVTDIVSAYEDSIHGKGLRESGLTVTATCASCHGAHSELPPDDPRSRVNPKNVAATCGTCHSGIEEKFRESIHWPGNGATEDNLPSCKDCHTSHTISRVDRDDFRFLMMDQCGRCHEEQAETFFETAHGKKSELHMAEPAKCYDCHGTHDILPVTDPASTLSRRNVVGTCGKCHERAHLKFAGYLTHATHHDSERYPLLFWTFWAMTSLLVGTLVFAVIHTMAWLVRLFLTRGEWKHHKPAPGEKLYRRFGRAQRTMHLMMLISFFTLAITGMSLKFAYMGWAQFISNLLGGAGAMGILHRLAAIILFTVMGVHFWDIRRKKRESGRTLLQMIRGPDSILFNLGDLKEFIGAIKWFVGLGPRPKFGRYTYWEKFDYFAVFWGIAVIGMTGLLLWFPELFTYVLPGWSVNVATIIHSDEALLAVGFIFTIHFFNTHFRPDKFPMDPVIFTGRVPLEELKADKPAEYERLVASGELEKHLVDPFPPRAERAAKIFGFLFLGIGLTLIALIVYAMVFGYR